MRGRHSIQRALALLAAGGSFTLGGLALLDALDLARELETTAAEGAHALKWTKARVENQLSRAGQELEELTDQLAIEAGRVGAAEQDRKEAEHAAARERDRLEAEGRSFDPAGRLIRPDSAPVQGLWQRLRRSLGGLFADAEDLKQVGADLRRLKDEARRLGAVEQELLKERARLRAKRKELGKTVRGLRQDLEKPAREESQLNPPGPESTGVAAATTERWLQRADQLHAATGVAWFVFGVLATIRFVQFGKPSNLGLD